MLMEYFDRYAAEHQPYKGGAWCYEDGLVYRGMEVLHLATGEDRWLAHIKRMVGAQLAEGPRLSGYQVSEYNIDNILSGRALMYLHAVTGQEVYLQAAGLLADQLETHPRTRSGVYWHKLRYPWQVWLDGLYMGLPFQISYGQRTNNPGLVEDALRQFHAALDMTHVAQTGLYAHAIDEAGKQPWANAGTGHSTDHWARALGWVAMALVDVFELIGPGADPLLARRAAALFERILSHQRPSGLWQQVIDQPDLSGNYEETSASAMFVYALLKGRDQGLHGLEVSHLFDRLIAAAVKPGRGGRLEMTDICHVAGLGTYQNRYRDGTAAYYVSEKRVSDDPKGVGPLMMGAAAAATLERQLVAST